MQQYFVNKINGKIILNNNDLYHLVKVLRAKANTEIICVLDDKKYLSTFTGNEKEYVVELIHEISNDTELTKDIILYQALIRNENFDLLLQKSVELGVKEIYPTIFKRNVVKIDKMKEENKINRFNLIAKGAAEQSHRGVIPKVFKTVELKDITLDDDEIGILCFENEKNISLFDIKDELKLKDKIKVVIGPEGGITTDEVNLLLDKGFKRVTLGKRILRSETAAFNILSVIGYILELER